MSSKARRLPHASGVAAFAWSGAPLVVEAPSSQRPFQPTPMPEPATHAPSLGVIEREAYAKGFAQGERAGADAAVERTDAMVRRFTQTLDELMTLRGQMIRQTERQMVQLALAVAQRIVRREVALDQDLILAMARVALDRLDEAAHITVRLHPAEFEATSSARASQWNSGHVTVVADPRVGRGGCRVESEFGTIEAGVDAQIQEITRALLGDDEGGPHGVTP